MHPRQLLLLTALLSTGGLFIRIPTATAEDLDTIFGRVKQYAEAKNYTKALDELAWARKELETANMTRVQELFPAEVNGLKAGEFKSNNALGFVNIERSYAGGGGQQITVELTSGTSGAAGASLGGLAQIGKMAAMMGGDMNSNTMRIAGRTASLSIAGSNPELSIFLDSGSVLKLTGAAKTDSATLRKFAEAMKLDDLDNYLRGATR